MRKRVTLLAAAVAAILVVLLLPWQSAQSQPTREVRVLNLPEVVPIEGKISVVGTIGHSAFTRRLSLILPPVNRQETTDLLVLDDLETAGFTAVVLSLQGDIRGTTGRAGAVGAVLVPDEEPVLEVMREKGIIQFPVEVTATVAQRQTASFSAQQHLALGFPRYKVYLYNSTDRTVDVNLYLYLTH